MALSNWDTLSIGNKSTSTDGLIKFKNGVTVELYKNWVYLRSLKLWDKDSGFTKPTFASFNNGEINIGNLYLKAKRGLQSGIYIYANFDKTFFAGIGCYGYGDRRLEYLKLKGVENPQKDDEGYWSEEWGSKSNYLCYYKKDEKEFRLKVDKNFDLNPWVGVTPETLSDFKKWLAEEIVQEGYFKEQKKWFDKINWDELVRFNQGDMFFTNSLGTNLQATKVGKKIKEPIIMSMLGKK